MPAVAQVSIDEFRTNLADLLGRVMYGDSRIVVRKFNREAAVIVSPEEYARLLDPTKRLNRQEWQTAIQTMENVRAYVPPIPSKTLEKIVTQTIKEARVQKRARRT